MQAIRQNARAGTLGLTLLAGVLAGVVIGDLRDDPQEVTVTVPNGITAAPGGGEAADLPPTSGPAATGATAGTTPPVATSPGGGASYGGAGQAPGSPSGQPGAAAPSASTGGSGPVETNARGTTGGEIRIGVAIPDISAFRYLGPAYDSGNIKEQWQAVEDDWRRKGLLTVHGRRIKFIYRQHNIIRPEEARAACVGLVQDDRSFMVLGTQAFGAGGECVAREFKTPILTLDGVQDEVYARSAPYLFTLALSEDRVLRNWVEGAHAGARPRGKTIGLYYPKTITEQVHRTVTAQLTKLGYKAAVEIQQGEGSASEDVVAVQRFRQAGVNLAMLLVGRTNFLQQAEAQGYHPTYIDSDYSFGTSDAAASTNPPSQWDGTEAFTGRTDGEINAGFPMSQKQAACHANYQRFAKRTVAKTDSAEMHYIMLICDEAEVARLALEQAGPALTPQAFVAALQQVRGVPLRRVPSVTFGAGRYEGVDRHRTLRWAGSCRCWKAVGSFAPLWV